MRPARSSSSASRIRSRPGDTYLLTFDNHNSVNGIREFARARGATVTYVPVVPPDLRVDADLSGAGLGRPPRAAGTTCSPSRPNPTSPGCSTRWSGSLRRRPKAGTCCWTRPRSRRPTGWILSRWHPDFVDISFYKIFGYPTGTGCLLVRKAAAHKLRRPWYAGGTITFSSVLADDHYLTPGPAGFEDGTVNYLSLPAVEIGLQATSSRSGSRLIHTRVMCLTGWLIEQLLALRHSNGRPLIRLYGPPNTDRRGGTVQVNFFDPDGHADRLQ